MKLSMIAPMAAAAALLFAAPAFAEGDAAAGEAVFKKCVACHATEAGKNKVGPSLAGVAGREAGGVEGFKYSSAMKESGLTWTDENLAKYLADPKGTVPKNKMAFPGLKSEDDIANVIAYLKGL